MAFFPLLHLDIRRRLLKARIDNEIRCIGVAIQMDYPL